MRRKALHPFISSALIIMLIMVSISLVLTVVKPILDKARDSAVINEAFRNLELMDDNIREVASEGEGSKRTILLRVTDGTYKIDGSKDYLNFSYRLKAGLDIGGKKGKINITRSADSINLFISYTKVDIQGSDHFTKGDNSVVISHVGINSSTNYPMIYVGR